MRRLGLFTLLAVTACFNPDDSEVSGTDAADDDSSSSSASNGTSDPTNGSNTTTSTTNPDPSATTSTTDPDPTDETGDTDPGMTTSDTGDVPACDGGERCVESAPDGWQGPGLRITGDSGPPPTCGMTYSVQGPGGFTGAAAPPAECECSCDFPTDVQCPDASITYYSGEVCGSAQGGNTINNVCDTFFIGQGINSVTAHANPPDDVGCTPSLDETIPPVGPMEPTALCLPESFGRSCGDGSTCLPEEDITTYCISQPGDVPCPADSSYDERTVIYADFDDNRACGECQCGAADVECGGFIRAYGGGNCGGGFITVPIDDSCVESIDDTTNSARYFAADATGTCPAGGGESEGEVTPLQPTTLCCADF